MKACNIVFFVIGVAMYTYSLIIIEDFLLSVLLGLLSVVLLFFDDLLYKPVELIGWELEKEKGK